MSLIGYRVWIFGACLKNTGYKAGRMEWDVVWWGASPLQGITVTPRANLEKQFSVISSGSDRSPQRHGRDHRETVDGTIQMRRTNISIPYTYNLFTWTLDNGLLVFYFLKKCSCCKFWAPSILNFFYFVFYQESDHFIASDIVGLIILLWINPVTVDSVMSTGAASVIIQIWFSHHNPMMQ